MILLQIVVICLTSCPEPWVVKGMEHVTAERAAQMGGGSIYQDVSPERSKEAINESTNSVTGLRVRETSR